MRGILSVYLAGSLFTALAFAQNDVGDIMSMHTVYEYGWYVGHIECLGAPEVAILPAQYYTNGMSQADQDDFAEGRAEGCVVAETEMEEVIRLCGLPENSGNASCPWLLNRQGQN